MYHLLRYGEAYVKRDEHAYSEQVRDRLEKSLHRRARELGFDLVKKLERDNELSASDTPLSV